MRLVRQRIAAVAVLLAAGPLGAQTQPVLPDSTGPFAVGRLQVDVTDASRDEIFTEDAADKRRLLVTVYYPATVPAGSDRALYGTPEIAAAWPLFFNPERRSWRSRSYEGVAAADGRFPVLLFSPGLGNMTLLYSSLLVELASRGYVVAALWHPYSTEVVAFPDNTVLRINDSGRMGGADPDEMQKQAARIGEVWAGDQRFVLNQIALMNERHAVLGGHLDLDRIGAFGHSLGGAAAVLAAYGDERIDAAINMDGAMFGPVTENGSRVPFLLVRSEIALPTDAELEQAGLSREEAEALLASIMDVQARIVARSKLARIEVIDGAKHNTFMTDVLFFLNELPTERRAGFGDVEPAKAFAAIANAVEDFMATHVARR